MLEGKGDASRWITMAFQRLESIMKKTGATLTSLALCLSLVLPTGAVAFADTGDQAASGGTDAVYVSDTYDNGIAPRTRGNCTDSYSRGWCNSHGYANNRPVPGRVILNSQELNCYFKAVAQGVAETVFWGVVKQPNGVYMAISSTAWRLWNCNF